MFPTTLIKTQTQNASLKVTDALGKPSQTFSSFPRASLLVSDNPNLLDLNRVTAIFAHPLRYRRFMILAERSFSYYRYLTYTAQGSPHGVFNVYARVAAWLTRCCGLSLHLLLQFRFFCFSHDQVLLAFLAEIQTSSPIQRV